MADGNKAEAGSVSRIGERIDRATGGAVKYDSYSRDQKLGQPDAKNLRGPDDPKQYIALEAAMAAIANNPRRPLMLDTVYSQLQDQALERDKATSHDLPKILKGQKLDGLPPAPVVNGKVKLGGLFMSDKPSEADVRAQDKGAPQGKLNSDLAKLKVADAVLKDPRWLVVEASSNVTNALRDVEINANGHKLTDKQVRAIRQGMQAEQKILGHLENATPIGKGQAHHLEQQVEGAMDAAAQSAGIKQSDPAYQHYRQDMERGIDAGLSSIKDALNSAGVTPAEQQAGIPTTKANTRFRTTGVVQK